MQDAPQYPTALPRVGITMGDPSGIGPEVVLKAVAEAEVRAVCQPIIIGDAQLLAHNARTLDLQCGYEIVRRDEPIPRQSSDPIIFHLNNIHGHVEPGVESGEAGRAAGEYIEAAVELCASGSIDAERRVARRNLLDGDDDFHTEKSAGVTLENETAVGAAKAERVGKRVIDAHGTGVVGHIVEIALRIGNLVVDGGRGDLIADREHSDAGFEAASAAEQMTGHRLGG